MDRANYSHDGWTWHSIMWRGAVAAAIRGKRGQLFLKELAAALDAMPDKRLIINDLIDARGEVCAIGSLGVARGIDLAALDPVDSKKVADAFGVADALVREVEYINDEFWRPETPADRWRRMRGWVASLIIPPAAHV